MYATISYIVENITNQTWEQYATEHILEPLNMRHTNFSVTDSQTTEDYALPYIENDGEIKKFHSATSIQSALLDVLILQLKIWQIGYFFT